MGGIGCRGIDTSHVGHVVLFDFPRDPSEYIRRVGRTARGAAGTGQSSILVLGRQVCSTSLSYEATDPLLHALTRTSTRAHACMHAPTPSTFPPFRPHN